MNTSLAWLLFDHGAAIPLDGGWPPCTGQQYWGGAFGSPRYTLWYIFLMASRVWHMLFLQPGRPFLPFLYLAYHPCSEELRSAITCLSLTPTTLPGVPLLASMSPELPTPGANHTIVSWYLLAFSSHVPNTQPGMKQAPSKCLWS